MARDNIDIVNFALNWQRMSHKFTRISPLPLPTHTHTHHFGSADLYLATISDKFCFTYNGTVWHTVWSRQVVSPIYLFYKWHMLTFHSENKKKKTVVITCITFVYDCKMCSGTVGNLRIWQLRHWSRPV